MSDPIWSQHIGHITYHCHVCGTDVSETPEYVAAHGGDVTKLCLCGRGTVVSENGQHVSLAKPWPIRPRATTGTHSDSIQRREEAASAERKARGRSEWREFDS
jgi:hypothetical protein